MSVKDSDVYLKLLPTIIKFDYVIQWFIIHYPMINLITMIYMQHLIMYVSDSNINCNIVNVFCDRLRLFADVSLTHFFVQCWPFTMTKESMWGWQTFNDTCHMVLDWRITRQLALDASHKQIERIDRWLQPLYYSDNRLIMNIRYKI